MSNNDNNKDNFNDDEEKGDLLEYNYEMIRELLFEAVADRITRSYLVQVSINQMKVLKKVIIHDRKNNSF